MRALTKCHQVKSNDLCHVKSLKSNQVDVGFRKDSFNDYENDDSNRIFSRNNSLTSEELYNICPYGEMGSHVCMLRHVQKSKDGQFYFTIMQPFPEEFDAIWGDIDIFSLSQEEKRLLEAARKVENKTVTINGMEKITKNVDDQGGTSFVQNVFMYRRQQMPNGLIMKLLKYDKSSTHYVVIICFSMNLKAEPYIYPLFLCCSECVF